MTALLCPDCRAPLPPRAENCPRCGLPLVGPLAAELGQVDQELAALHARLTGLSQEYAGLDARRVAVLSRRGELIRLLRNAVRRVVTPAEVSPPAGASQQATAAIRPAVRAATEASGHSIQTVLLALGGLLLAVAAIAFTVFAWGHFGIPGRAIVLSVLTAVTFAVPAVLVRFKLTATAETIAAVGLVLVGLDGYAAWKVGLFGVDHTLDGQVYAGLVAAVVTAVGVGYPALVPLRLPRIAAVLTGQAVLPLLAGGLELHALPYGTVAAAVAAADLAVVALAKRRRATVELILAAIAATVATATAISQTVAEFVVAPDHRIAPAALLLAALGGLGLVAAELVGVPLARQTAAAAAVLVVAVGAYRTYLTTDWDIPAAAFLALVAVSVAVQVPGPWRRGAVTGASLVLGSAAIVPALWTAAVGLFPAGWLMGAWSVPSALTRAQAIPDASTGPGHQQAYALAALAAAAAVLAARFGGRRELAYVGAGSVAVGALLVPVSFHASLAVVLGVELVVAGAFAAGWVAMALRPARVVAAVVAIAAALGVHAAVWSTANRTTTLVTLGALALGWAGAASAVLARLRRAARAGTEELAEGATGALLGVAVVAALLATSAEVAAVAAALHATRLEVAYSLVTSTVVALCAALALRRTAPSASLLALAVVPVVAYTGTIAGALELDRAGRGLLAALSGTAVTLAAALVTRLARTPESDYPDKRAVSGPLSAPKPRQFAWTSLLGLGLAAAAVAPPVMEAVAGPLTWIGSAWRGAPEHAAHGLAPDFAWSGSWLDVVTLLVLGVAGAGFAVRRGHGWRPAALAIVPAWTLAALLAPLAADAPWPVALSTVTLLALAAAAVAALTPAGITRTVATGYAAALGTTALTWSLAAEPATVSVLGVVVVAGGTAAVLGRTAAARLAGTVLSASAALAEAGVVAHVAGLPRYEAAYAVLGTAAALTAIAAALRAAPADPAATSATQPARPADAGAATAGTGDTTPPATQPARPADAGAVRAPIGRALEWVAIAGGLLALALTAGHGWDAALVLTLAGVVTGLTALRADRRLAAIAAVVLEIAASWVWLDISGVRVPEAYTLPAALIGLGAGVWTLRRSPAVSSWATLGPGLAATFLPSLVLTFDEAGPSLRPLLLGLAALGATVAGAQTRRQAPFALGTATVALVAVRMIWPYLPLVVAAVPTWVPLAVGGLVLVTLGATYEQRLRDLRRVRHVVGRMR